MTNQNFVVKQLKQQMMKPPFLDVTPIVVKIVHIEKNPKKGEDTKYKGIVYQKFMESLKNFSNIDFDVDDAGSLIHLPLREYTALNRLAIKLAKEWAFWAPSVLGEANNE